MKIILVSISMAVIAAYVVAVVYDLYQIPAIVQPV